MIYFLVNYFNLVSSDLFLEDFQKHIRETLIFVNTIETYYSETSLTRPAPVLAQIGLL